jgi:hypothetical protein
MAADRPLRPARLDGPRAGRYRSFFVCQTGWRMGTGWVIAALAAAVAGLQYGRRRHARTQSDVRADLRSDPAEGLAPGSVRDSSADDTRPSAHSPGAAARLDWNA